MRVLYVDDNLDSCVLVRTAVEMRRLKDVQFETAGGGKAGFDAFFDARVAGRPYDAVLIDIAMPNLDGYTLARLIRTLELGRQSTPVRLAFITAHGREMVSSYEIEANKIDFCWYRPDDMPHLIDGICQWLTGSPDCKEGEH